MRDIIDVIRWGYSELFSDRPMNPFLAFGLVMSPVGIILSIIVIVMEIR